MGHVIDMLRLDLVHPIVSGNKWYKLSGYIKEAQIANASHLASFGGPYSNHIVALAYAGKEFGFHTIGYIRTNKDEPITPSLEEALSYGMQLEFLGRTKFQEKKASLLREQNTSKTYFIDEGGYGKLGAIGFASITEEVDLNSYDYIMAAVGTGTMLAGLISISQTHQEIIGIPVLKNEGTIASEINKILPCEQKPFTLLHQFHQGGYAKTTIEQINCMNQFWEQTNIATDIVYTGKLVTAFETLLRDQYFEKGKKILLIHSGGLQGNRSVASGVLHF
jgi:1-aminocyclopropane-1-carboxylate deaminase